MKTNQKAILASLITVGAAAGALAQGTVAFENYFSTGVITLGPNTGPASYAQAGTSTVLLLWAPGTSPVPQSLLTQLAIYGAATGGLTQNGYFYDPATITTGNATVGPAPAIFEVQGWSGNYTSYAAAVAAGAYAGQTTEFVNGTSEILFSASPPPTLTTGWDGNLILVVPEPGTLALGGLGAAALLFFRRRKMT
jgi:hypothetical protein